METLGIMLSMFAAFAGVSVYSVLLNRLVAPRHLLRRAVLAVSIAVLGAFFLEVVLVTTLGAVASRALLGPSFTVAHVVLFLGAIPALAGVLTLATPRGFGEEWSVVAAICAVCAPGVVLMQYGVSEALFGIDGSGGPFPGPW